MEGRSAFLSRDEHPRSDQQVQHPLLDSSGSSGRIRRRLTYGSGDAETARERNHHAGCRQHTSDVRTTPKLRTQLTVNQADSRLCSTVFSRTGAQLQSNNEGRSRSGDPEQLAIESGASVKAEDCPSVYGFPTNNFQKQGGQDDTRVKWASRIGGVTQHFSQRVSYAWSAGLCAEECIRCRVHVPSRRPSARRNATASPADFNCTSGQFCEPLVDCKKSVQTRGSHGRGGLSRCGEKWISASSCGCPPMQPLSWCRCSCAGLRDGESHQERSQTLSENDSGKSLPHVCEAPRGQRGNPAAVQKYGMFASNGRLNTKRCPAGTGSTYGGIRFSIEQRRRLLRFTSCFGGAATEAQDVEARRPPERLFSSSANPGHLKHRKKRSLSSPAGQNSSDKYPPTADDRGQSRTASRVASLATVARSRMQKRVSAGTDKGSGTHLLTSKNSRSVHHVFFSTHTSRRLSLQKIAAENGSATEASENGKTASSRTSSSGTITEKSGSRRAGEYGFHGSGTTKVAAFKDAEKKELDMRVRVAALSEASVTFFGAPHTESHDRRLLHRSDPAKLLRVSCSKCFSDDHARQTRFIEVNRPIVCDEGCSTRYFRKKGEASGAPGSWPAGDSGSTVISRRLACMLVREVQREVRYGVYPLCTRAAMLWASVLGSILFLSIGAWLTVEDDRHIECRLNYEREMLQDSGSRYTLLTITPDSCSGRLRTIRADTADSAEKRRTHKKGRKASKEDNIIESNDASEELKESSDRGTTSASFGYAGRASQFEGPVPVDSDSDSVRNAVPKRRAMGYSASSSAPLSYFFSLPPPMPRPQPQKTETASVVAELSGPYIYVYIEMDHFYQNDAQVVWSRKDEQLAGKIFTEPDDLKECEPAVTAVVRNVTKVLHPCGVLAWSVFTDRFQFLDAVPDGPIDQAPVRALVLEQSQDVLLNSLGDWRKRFKNPPADVRAKYRDRVYFWMSLGDNDDGKDMYKTREEAKAELLVDRLNYEEAGEMVENGHFIQWMHTAPFGTWRKYYGRIRGPVKLPLFAYVAVTYDVKQWKGKKAIVLVQPSTFNGRTQFLGSAYLFLGCLLAIVAGYIVWRKWFTVPEEKAVDYAEDLRWRTYHKRRGKTR